MNIDWNKELFKAQKKFMGLLCARYLQKEPWIWIRQRGIIEFLLNISLISAFLYSAIINYQDLLLMMDFLGPCIGFTISSIRVLFFFVDHKSIINLHNSAKEIAQNLPIQNQVVLKRKIRAILYISTIFFCTTVGGHIFYIFPPLLDTILQLIRGEESVKWLLPFNLLLPFDSTSPFLYIFIYIWSSYTLLVLTTVNIIVDSMFLESSILIAAHFEFIQERFENFNFFSENFTEIQNQLVNDHLKVIQLKDKLRHVYKVTVPFFFILASLVLCTIFFATSLVIRRLKVFVFIGYSAACMFEFSFYTYGGTIVTHASQKVSEAAYSSAWYSAPVRNRQLILMVMARTQNEPYMQMGFFNVSLITFVKILSSALSYITILRSFNDSRGTN